ncbi:MAG: IMPACT family protein [Saprospiraceae bacterium]|nr:IMPACT family protein [Saprospiraceae bacterium]
MMDPDQYRTIAREATSEIRERASKFFGFAFPLLYPLSWQERLDEIRHLHPKATHHCYAYRYGPGTDVFRANDDGEPSGSAGKPILGQIDSFELANILIIVVRYYGGTKLGVPGLIHAYREAARMALESAEIVEAYYHIRLKVKVLYPMIPDVMHVGKQYDWQIIDQSYTADAQTITADIRESFYREFCDEMQIKAGGLYPDEILDGKLSPDIEIKRIQEDA